MKVVSRLASSVPPISIELTSAETTDLLDLLRRVVPSESNRISQPYAGPWGLARQLRDEINKIIVP